MDEKWNQKLPWNKWKWKHNNAKLMGCSKSSSKREVHSYIQAYLKKEEISKINKLNLHLKELEKEQNQSKL